MALFKSRKKEIDFYETEATLPGFSIDSNGFIMFDQSHLGGAAVIEVIPHVFTESMTHEDPIYHNTNTEFDENPNYEPIANALFPDKRSVVYPAWVHFLNSLMNHGPEDEPTHLQILAKKCRTDEWNTRIDYACYKGEIDFEDVLYPETITSHTSLLAARADDYLRLLHSIKTNIDEVSPNTFDIRVLPAYKTRFFIVVPYTPSSEGWWMDGRDTDYYVSDTSSPLSLFKDDKLVNRIVGMLTRFRKNDEDAMDVQEDDFFWINNDRVAQILDTRVKKIFSSVDIWNKREKNRPMPFHLVKLDGREVAALIRFFPNILTPYWDKIWDLNADQDDVLYRIEAQRAIDMIDEAFIYGEQELNKQIASGTVDMRHSKQEQNEFLSKYKGVAFEDIDDIRSELDEKSWTPEEEERRRIYEVEKAHSVSEYNDLWGDIDDTLAIAQEYKTPDQKRDEFLQHYRHRRVNNNLNRGDDKKE